MWHLDQNLTLFWVKTMRSYHIQSLIPWCAFFTFHQLHDFTFHRLWQNARRCMCSWPRIMECWILNWFHCNHCLQQICASQEVWVIQVKEDCWVHSQMYSELKWNHHYFWLANALKSKQIIFQMTKSFLTTDLYVWHKPGTYPDPAKNAEAAQKFYVNKLRNSSLNHDGCWAYVAGSYYHNIRKCFPDAYLLDTSSFQKEESRLLRVVTNDENLN